MIQSPQTPEQVSESKANIALASQKKQKILKGILIFSAVVIVLSLIFSLIDPEALVKKWFDDDETKKEPIYFYKIDDELNRLDNEEYLQLDHRMYYHNPYDGITYSVEEEMLADESDEVVFFYRYFDAIRRGNCDTVANMYSKTMKDIPENFTLQMIYDIKVEPQLDGGEVFGYRVDYMIYRNNGSFRNDVGSDINRPLLITLTTEGGELKISSVRRYTTTVLK